MKIHFHYAKTEPAKKALQELKKLHSDTKPEEADVIVALGGDGTLLEALHQYYHLKKPVYGLNKGSVGFLLNPFKKDDLETRLKNAQSVTLHPLEMTAQTAKGEKIEAVAFNEVSLLRQRHFAAKINISVDGIERMEELICDGILLSTAAGSTAYNLSAHGPIVPMSAEVLALTPISAFRPRHWRGALLPRNAKVTFSIIDPSERPVSATADYTEVRNILSVDISESQSISVTLLFDPGHNLEERILIEQFAY
jgi:NAD+ kinase